MRKSVGSNKKEIAFADLKLQQPLGIAPVYDDTLTLALVASRQPKGKVLDMGTGTGYVAIFLAKKGFLVEGTDINRKAVYVAKQNSKMNGVNCRFFISDLFKNVRGKFDIVTFNPPLGNASGSKFLEVIKSAIRKNRFLRYVSKPVALLFLQKSRKDLISKFVNECPFFLKKKGRFLIVLDRSEISWAKRIVPKEIYFQFIQSSYKDDAHIVLKAVLK